MLLEIPYLGIPSCVVWESQNIKINNQKKIIILIWYWIQQKGVNCKKNHGFKFWWGANKKLLSIRLRKDTIITFILYKTLKIETTTAKKQKQYCIPLYICIPNNFYYFIAHRSNFQNPRKLILIANRKVVHWLIECCCGVSGVRWSHRGVGCLECNSFGAKRGRGVIEEGVIRVAKMLWW